MTDPALLGLLAKLYQQASQLAQIANNESAPPDVRKIARRACDAVKQIAFDNEPQWVPKAKP